MTVRTWARDLALGIRFGASGGREGWTRTLLTALGVGLGVAMLLLASSVPGMIEQRDDRADRRTPAEIKQIGSPEIPPSARTVLWDGVETLYRDRVVKGTLLRADGADPVRPPGVAAFPKPGEMVVSPALGELLRSPEGKLLGERYGGKITGTIGDEGVLGSRELYFYLGSADLTQESGSTRISSFDDAARTSPPLNPILVVLLVLVCVVLLVPVAVFVATAVRFGGERRDRRLAALRLVGADTRTVHRIAGGEALFGALLGLAFGIGLFFAVRPLAGYIGLYDLSAFPSDVTPAPLLGALIVVAVPVSAVAVTLLALRTVVIEPLGVVRHSATRQRRLWWRLLPPALGIALLLTGRLGSGDEDVAVFPIAAGAILVLIGLTALLPWLVDAVVGRLRGGSVPWQLAVRRLQLSSDAAARAVSGIMVAVAGAIALQMLFSAVEGDFVRETEQDLARAQLSVTADVTGTGSAGRVVTDLRGTEGVRTVSGVTQAQLYSPARTPEEVAAGHGEIITLTVADCPTLGELAELPSCKDGDAFVVVGRDTETGALIRQSAALGKPFLTGAPRESTADGKPVKAWSLPEGAPTVTARPDAADNEHPGIFATPGAVDLRGFPAASAVAMVSVDKGVPDAREHVRNTVARIDPGAHVWQLTNVEEDEQFAKVRIALLIGSLATMALIAASMLVSQIEQLRERRKLLSVLVAFGTRRATIAWSVLWQTAVPVVIGTVLAIAGGLGLGLVMLELVGARVADWWGFLPIAGAGIAVIVVVTVLSLPPLYRMMRPDGLRTE
ncbi:FtsX-like permease family protein [Streptomyces tsukubensis]